MKGWEKEEKKKRRLGSWQNDTSLIKMAPENQVVMCSDSSDTGKIYIRPLQKLQDPSLRKWWTLKPK